MKSIPIGQSWLKQNTWKINKLFQARIKIDSVWDRFIAREGVIMEWPLNGQFHDRRDMILTSWMAVINMFLTVAVI